jgi:hypothetical protein
LTGFGLFALAIVLAASKAWTAPRAESAVERGRYLVSAIGCHDCHTPWTVGEHGPEPDMSRMLSGHPMDQVVDPAPALGGTWQWAGAGSMTAFVGPWGTSYAANLTPDELTGLGIWTEDMFVRAIRLGKHWGQSRPIMPPMPWKVYRNLSDEDLHAVWAYLRSIPPIENRVPDYRPPE